MGERRQRILTVSGGAVQSANTRNKPKKASVVTRLVRYRPDGAIYDRTGTQQSHGYVAR